MGKSEPQASAPSEAIEANAKIAHEAQHRATLASHGPVITFGVEALKSTILLNGGTAGALLAFVGQKGISNQPGLGEAFHWFAGGLLLGGIATAFSYLAQFCYARAAGSYINTWIHPYIKNTPAFRKWNVAGWIFHGLGVLAVLISFGAAVRGFWIAARALPF